MTDSILCKWYGFALILVAILLGVYNLYYGGVNNHKDVSMILGILGALILVLDYAVTK